MIILHSRHQRLAARATAECLMITAVIVLSSATSTTAQLPEYPPGESIEALQHHQPVDNEVLQREIERYGRRSVEQEEKREDAEIDELYGDVMRRSASLPGEGDSHDTLPTPRP